MPDVEDKLDKISDRLTSIDITLAKQSVILDEHVKRSNMLEESLGIHQAEINARLKPIEDRNNLINGAVKILGAASFLVTLAVSVLKLLKLL